jgi:hypothetical protein
MNVTIPKNNVNERRYIVDTLLGEFLGLDYCIDESEHLIDSWCIEFEESILLVEDHFFNAFPKPLSYLDKHNIPSNILFTKNRFIQGEHIPILFGREKLVYEEHHICCGIDLFASSFFMLTRWEEYLDEKRDHHQRSLSIESVARKYNFLHRPIVNEYVEMVWSMLKFLGIKQRRKPREYQSIPTHDVDFPLRYFSAHKVFREIGRDVIKNRIYRDAFKKLKAFIGIKLGFQRDPYDTFDYMIDFEKSLGLRSYFFFMAEGTNALYDDDYDIQSPFILNLVEKIKKAGHYIGIHPSYDTLHSKEQLKREKRHLESLIGKEVLCGRQHYLRFEVPTTWQYWEDLSMVWDSTLTYADREGFRCGVCYEYHLFNISTRQKLSLKERPLIVMEGSFFIYQSSLSLEMIEERVTKLISEVKKYRGNFVFLWHNSAFDSISHKRVYEHTVLESIG